MTSKTCSKCQESKPVGEFSLDRSRLSGLQPWCKSCIAGHQAGRKDESDPGRAERRKAKAAKDELFARGLKHCGKCNEVLHLMDFARRRDTAMGVKSNCKSCCKDMVKRSMGKNIGKHRAKNSEWARSNPEKVKGIQNARRAREQGAGGSFDWVSVLAVFGHQCALCGTTEDAMTAGHIVPLSRGGTNWTWNIRPECQRCNSTKHNKLDSELPPEMFKSYWPHPGNYFSNGLDILL